MEGFYVTTLTDATTGFDRIQLDGACRQTIECLAEMVANIDWEAIVGDLDPKSSDAAFF